MVNKEIKNALSSKGITQWKLADKLGITEWTLSRKLRKELPDDEKKTYLEIIDEMGESNDE